MIAVASLGVLGVATAGVGTAAWYTANSAATASGSLTVTESSISAGDYNINFEVAPTDSELQLGHVATEANVSAELNGIDSLTAGDLVYGVISNGVVVMRKCASISDFGTTFTITPS